MISDLTVQRVRDIDILDVIKPYVDKLQRTGANYTALCPFHSERTGSFSITPSKNVWYCFGCGEGGDGIAFIRKLKNMGFYEAVEDIAKEHNIYIERIEKPQTPQQKKKADTYKQMQEVLDTLQRYYVAQFNLATSEAEAARNYAYKRLGKEFCIASGIGYAPSDSLAFLQFCRVSELSAEVVSKLGYLRRSDKDDSIYPLLRGRITIPITDYRGNIIAFTARTLDPNNKSKYLNSINSPKFQKSEAVFGICEARRNASKYPYVVAVEGAPDVLRLQSIGMPNAVATLGTAWSDSQFDLLRSKAGVRSICFIPDADPPKGGTFGPGILAVMKNGAAALRRGFDVTVRELPPGPDGAKNDADSYITSQEIFNDLQEVHFCVWLAQKKFPLAVAMAEQRDLISEIASLLACVSDKILLDSCIAELAKIHGRVKLWRDAVEKIRSEKQRSERVSSGSASDREAELLKKYGLFIRDNMYFCYTDKGETERLSNFIMKPLYHIKDGDFSTRIFKLINEYGEECVIEFDESDLVSLPAFKIKVGRPGNYVWKSKADKLETVKEFIYSLTDSAEIVRQMGWDGVREFYAFGNGLLHKRTFYAVDNLGIVTLPDGCKYYLPATAEMYRNNPAVYQFERLFQHENRSAITLYDFAKKVIDVFGDNGKVGLCFLFASLFRDIIYPIKNCFPLANFFGLKGTGKTSLATCLQSFFVHGIDPPNLAVATIPSINDRVSQVTNAMVVLDEYKNDLDERKIAYLKALWGGSGQTKKNMAGDKKASQTVVTAAVCICGQDLPTRDLALYSRVIHLTFPRPSFNQEERRRFEDLKELSNLGNTHLAIEVLGHRSLMENGYRQNHNLVRKELSQILADEEIEDRILDNWVVPLATFRTLENALRLPLSYTELFDITLAGIRYQNEGCKKNSEMADFWEVLDSLHSQGRIIEKAHFKIRYLTEFKPIGATEPIRFAKPTPILFLNGAAVSTLYTGRVSGGATAQRSNNWSTMLTYLKVQPSFLGLKQDRFNILLSNGTLDYVMDGTQRKYKANRPKALCFDYSILKANYNLNLETSAVSEYELDNDDEPSADTATGASSPAASEPSQSSLFQQEEDDVPF